MGLVEIDLTDYYFEKVNQEDIFKIVFGNIDFNSYVTNPLREDKTPGAWFEWKNNILYFRDFAYGSKPLNAIEFLKEYYKASTKEVYEIIDQVLIDKTRKPEEIKIKTGKRKKHNSGGKAEIYFLPDEFRQKDKKYWEQYKINKSFLEQENVFPTNNIITVRENKYKEIHSYSRCYAYSFFNCVKIYCPYNNYMKFITNCSNNVVGCKDNIDYSKKHIVITKSLKDCGVLKNLGLNAVWFQNEGMIPKDLDFLKNFDNILIFYDNDEPGVKASERVRSYLSNFLGKKVYRYHLPKKLFLESKIKDPSDFVKVYGYKKLRKILNVR